MRQGLIKRTRGRVMRKLIVLSLLMVLLGAGCVVRPTALPDIDLVLLDDTVKSYIIYDNHRRTRTPSGQLGAVVNFYNVHTTRDIAIDWMLRFYDSEGFEIEKTAWTSVLVPKQQNTSIKTNCMSRECSDFKMYIRESGN
jgi:uncharacterized protein YcfL